MTGQPTELQDYFDLRMRKMSSYHWFGIWMGPHGTPLPKPLTFEDMNQQILVGEIRGLRKSAAQLQVALTLWDGGWRPGDTLEKAQILLKTLKGTHGQRPFAG